MGQTSLSYFKISPHPGQSAAIHFWPDPSPAERPQLTEGSDDSVFSKIFKLKYVILDTMLLHTC